MTIKEQMEIITVIKYSLGISTGTAFEDKVNSVLKRAYRHLGKDYQVHSSAGGDGGNDGWIKSDKFFVQIYGPQKAKGSRSVKSDIHNKFKTNLSTLLNHIEKGNWGGEIQEYVFIVNTQDIGLPADISGDIEKTVAEMRTTYSKACQETFTAKLENLDYVTNLLEDVTDLAVLERISVDINAPIFDKHHELTEAMVLTFFETLLARIEDIDFPTLNQDLNRISLASKIKLNQLDAIRANIFSNSTRLDVIEDAVKKLNEVLPLFEKIRNCFVHEYRELLQDETLSEVQIYHSIVNKIKERLGGLYNRDFEYAAEHTLVYIIDRCEIFKKE